MLLTWVALLVKFWRVVSDMKAPPSVMKFPVSYIPVMVKSLPKRTMVSPTFFCSSSAAVFPSITSFALPSEYRAPFTLSTPARLNLLRSIPVTEKPKLPPLEGDGTPDCELAAELVLVALKVPAASLTPVIF